MSAAGEFFAAEVPEPRPEPDLRKFGHLHLLIHATSNRLEDGDFFALVPSLCRGFRASQPEAPRYHGRSLPSRKKPPGEAVLL